MNGWIVTCSNEKKMSPKWPLRGLLNYISHIIMIIIYCQYKYISNFLIGCAASPRHWILPGFKCARAVCSEAPLVAEQEAEAQLEQGRGAAASCCGVLQLPAHTETLSHAVTSHESAPSGGGMVSELQPQ